MLRLIHNQTVQGPLLVDDIDDGLPNKEVHRLGSQADPKAYARDGYANKVKQSCYLPFSHKVTGTSTLVKGFINLNQTPRVLFSAGPTGKIGKMQKAGLITVVSTIAADFLAPVITAAPHGTPVTITGTTLLSIAPDLTVVTFTQGTGATAPNPLTLTQAQILGAAGGSISETSIVIPASLFTTAPVLNNTVKVTANEQTSNTFVMT
jgi:hypothetical protein